VDLRPVTGEYAARLLGHRMRDVSRRRLGWRFWYGGPWAATDLVTARNRDDTGSTSAETTIDAEAVLRCRNR